MHAGDRISHPEHGEGAILAFTTRRRARVRFDLTPKLPRTVARADLAPLGAGVRDRSRSELSTSMPMSMPWGNSRRRVTDAGGVSSADLADLRQTIEAMRLGVVPARHIRDYTVGREAELAALDGLLDDGRGLRLLWGDYGHGKTHQLEVFERVASERNYVTARVTLDPSEVPPTHPKRLYRAIVAALSYPGGNSGGGCFGGGGSGLDPLMHSLVQSEEHRGANGSRRSRFLSPWLHALHVGDEELAAWMRDYASGLDVEPARLRGRLTRAGWRGDRPFALSDFRTYGRLYVHLLGTIATWTRDAGYRGLLLLFDEVEGIDHLRSEQLEYGRQVLMHFAATALPPSRLGFDPESHGDLYRGGREVHRRLSLRFRRDQPLAVVFALTPLEEIQQLLGDMVAGERFDVHLRPLGVRDVRGLTERVRSLYERAYPRFELNAERGARLVRTAEEAVLDGRGGARDIVRGLVFTLDGFRLRCTDGSAR